MAEMPEMEEEDGMIDALWQFLQYDSSYKKHILIHRL